MVIFVLKNKDIMKKTVLFFIAILFSGGIISAQEGTFFLKLRNVKKGTVSFPLLSNKENCTFNDSIHNISYSNQIDNHGNIVDSVYSHADTLFINLISKIHFCINSTPDSAFFYEWLCYTNHKRCLTYRLDIAKSFPSFNVNNIVICAGYVTHYYKKSKKNKFIYYKSESCEFTLEKIKQYKWKEVSSSPDCIRS